MSTCHAAQDARRSGKNAHTLPRERAPRAERPRRRRRGTRTSTPKGAHLSAGAHDHRPQARRARTTLPHAPQSRHKARRRLHGAAKAVHSPALRPEGRCPHRRFRVAIQQVLLQALRVRRRTAHGRRHGRCEGLRHRRPLRQCSPPALQSLCGAGNPRRPRLRHRFPTRAWRQLRPRSGLRTRAPRGRSAGGRGGGSSRRLLRRRLRPPRFRDLASGGHVALQSAQTPSPEPKRESTAVQRPGMQARAHMTRAHRHCMFCALRRGAPRHAHVHTYCRMLHCSCVRKAPGDFPRKAPVTENPAFYTQKRPAGIPTRTRESHL